MQVTFMKRMVKQGQEAIKPETPRYIYLGPDRNQHGIWELSLNGHTETFADERMPLKAEFTWWKNYQVRLDLVRDVMRRIA